MTPRERTASLLRNGVGGPSGVRRPALLLAPMATIGHAGFRTLVREFGGCDLFMTEMISAEALTNGTPFESSYRSLLPSPETTIYQLVGYSSGAILDAARILHGLRRAEFVGDRTDPADPRRDVGCLAEVAPAQERLEEARRFDDLELDVLDHPPLHLEVERALPFDAGQVVDLDGLRPS